MYIDIESFGKMCIFFYFQYNVLSVIAFVFGPFRYILNIDCYELFPNGNWIVNGYKFYFLISYQWFPIDIWCFFHHNSCAFVRPNSCMKCFFVVKSQRIKPTIKTRNDWVPCGTTCYTNNEHDLKCAILLGFKRNQLFRMYAHWTKVHQLLLRWINVMGISGFLIVRFI